MSLEFEWAVNKAIAAEKLEALIALGLPIALARELARWNNSYDFDTFAGMQDGSATPETGLRLGLILLSSRSSSRVNPDQLDGGVLEAGKQYAIFINDFPELGINFISFKLDGITVHTEFSAPWDYAGTAGSGDANRVTFVAGSHSIEAEITDGYGFYTIEASFEVE